MAHFHKGKEGRIFALIKRCMDLAGSLVGMCATGLLYIPIAMAIKWDSRGPVIYAQERVGKDEHSFILYKFRTMYLNSDGHGKKPDPSDERVTRVGRFLRRASLDELPQFFNILRGDMSLVGPRPELWVFEAQYQDWQRRRFLVKPGLTGWWQVNGRKQPMHAHIDEDIYYVDHCSIWLDLKIIWRTWEAWFSGRGAV
jgi:lipopolysaccharide/colanic/teichoic acid biosynthesis glycosyltransferase